MTFRIGVLLMMRNSGKRDSFLRVKSFHLSVQGAGHIRRNKECQDASASRCCDQYSMAVVCDGHGGDDYIRSALGAQFACAAAESSIQSFLQTMEPERFLTQKTKQDARLRQLEASIINAWNKAVAEHYREHPLSAAETSCLSERAKKRYLEDGQIESAYGTTLIAAAMTPEYWFGLQIGDGKCVVIDKSGTFTQPVPWDEQCFLNATTSICDSNALQNFRHFFSGELPAAIFLGSDGVDDCFSTEQQLNHLYQTITYSFATSSFDCAVSGLEDYLPRLSAKGSSDDVSISAILDLDAISELAFMEEYSAEPASENNPKDESGDRCEA